MMRCSLFLEVLEFHHNLIHLNLHLQTLLRGSIPHPVSYFFPHTFRTELLFRSRRRVWFYICSVVELLSCRECEGKGGSAL